MNGILGMTELVLEGSLDPEQRQHLDVVKSSADALLHIIDDILDFSKIEAGKLDLSPAPFGLRAWLTGTMELFALRAHRKGLELTCDVMPDVPDGIVADPDRLRQVVVNLVGNAIKFTEQGEVSVEVSLHEPAPVDRAAEAPADQGCRLRFAIRDTGIGIPESLQQRIFDAFEQADGSVSRRYGGTGLGLAISSRLVEMMGGGIRVESESGQGSTFVFTVNVGLNAAVEPAVEAAPLAQLRGRRVLVVDDHATNRRILERTLTQWGLSPALAADARSAVHALRTSRDGDPFDLLLVDVHMPEMDGYTLVEHARADRLLADAAVVMLTSDRRPGDLERCRALGVAAHLIKPIRQSDLAQTIQTALAPRPAASVAEVRAQAPVEGTAAAPARLRILVAEDNPVNQRLARALLARRGHEVVIAGDGRQAVDVWTSERTRIDAIFMDVQMPDMDGLEATQAIRQAERALGTRVPIVAMTAHAMSGDRERCLGAGMDDYITKPIAFDAVDAVLARLAA
jgi:CheY-like chemotaxis protein